MNSQRQSRMPRHLIAVVLAAAMMMMTAAAQAHGEFEPLEFILPPPPRPPRFISDCEYDDVVCRRENESRSYNDAVRMREWRRQLELIR